MNTTIKNLALGLGALIVVALAYFAWNERQDDILLPPSAASSTLSAASSSTTGPSTSTATSSSTTGVLGVSGTGTFTVRPVSSPTTPVAPGLNTPLACVATVAADYCMALKKDAAAKTVVLASEPSNFKAWIDLGADRKHAGDYQGAAAAWEYASILYPTNVISFNNLGDLYMNFIHDYPKAESNYLREIANKPNDINSYTTLFTLYSELYKQNTPAAVDILNKGIAANPNETSLKAMLDDYNKQHTSN